MVDVAQILAQLFYLGRSRLEDRWRWTHLFIFEMVINYT